MLNEYYKIEADESKKISEGKLNVRTRRNLLRLSAEHGIVWDYNNIRVFIKKHYGKTLDITKARWDEIVKCNEQRSVEEELRIIKHEKLPNGMIRAYRKGRIAKTIVVLGKWRKEKVVYVRRETKNRQAGQTKLYLSNGKVINVHRILEGLESIERNIYG